MRNLFFLILLLGLYLPSNNQLYGQVDTAQFEEQKNIEDRLKSVGISSADSLTWCDSCGSSNTLIQKEMLDFHKSTYESDILFFKLSQHGIKGDFLIRLIIHSSTLQVKVIKTDNVYMIKDDSSLMLVIGNLLDNIIGGSFKKVGDDYHCNIQSYWIKKDGVEKFSFHAICGMMGGFDNATKEALGSNYRIFELLMDCYEGILRK